MKIVFLSVETKSEAWVEEAKETYNTKLQGFFDFEIVHVKSPSIERDDASFKKRLEGEKVLKALKPGDKLVVFDEAGKNFASSEQFATQFQRLVEQSPQRIVFLIGGAFGVDDTVLAKAIARWSLSGLTMNHWIAQIVALEQIYRAATIIKKIPYHNR